MRGWDRTTASRRTRHPAQEPANQSGTNEESFRSARNISPPSRHDHESCYFYGRSRAVLCQKHELGVEPFGTAEFAAARLHGCRTARHALVKRDLTVYSCGRLVAFTKLETTFEEKPRCHFPCPICPI